MTKVANPRVRLGRGHATPGNTATWEARRLFFRAVYEVSPQVYWSLFPFEASEAAYRDWCALTGGDFAATITQWQTDWNLTDDWAAVVAWRTIQRRLGNYLEGRVCVLLGEDQFVVPRIRPQFRNGLIGLPAREAFWDVERESRESARKRLHAVIDAELDRVAAMSSDPETSTKTPEHFTWIARCHLTQANAQTIAKELLDDPDATLSAISNKARTIQKANADTARLIGLSTKNTNNSPKVKSS
jgi:hypothetical protein